MKTYTRLLIISAITVCLFSSVILGPLAFQAYRDRARRIKTMENLRSLSEAVIIHQAKQATQDGSTSSDLPAAGATEASAE